MDEYGRVRRAVLRSLYELGVDLETLDVHVGVGELLAGDDIGLAFIPEVESELGISVPNERWESVKTVQDVIDMLAKQLRSAH